MFCFPTNKNHSGGLAWKPYCNSSQSSKMTSCPQEKVKSVELGLLMHFSQSSCRSHRQKPQTCSDASTPCSALHMSLRDDFIHSWLRPSCRGRVCGGPSGDPSRTYSLTGKSSSRLTIASTQRSDKTFSPATGFSIMPPRKTSQSILGLKTSSPWDCSPGSKGDGLACPWRSNSIIPARRSSKSKSGSVKNKLSFRTNFSRQPKCLWKSTRITKPPSLS